MLKSLAIGNPPKIGCSGNPHLWGAQLAKSRSSQPAAPEIQFHVNCLTRLNPRHMHENPKRPLACTKSSGLALILALSQTCAVLQKNVKMGNSLATLQTDREVVCVCGHMMLKGAAALCHQHKEPRRDASSILQLRDACSGWA